MKAFKRALGIFLALLLMVSIPVAAFADEYNIADGSIWIEAGGETQYVYVWQDGIVDSVEDSSPVITGSSENNGISIYADEGTEATVTLQDVTAAYLETYGDGDATVTVEGANTLVNGGDLYNNTTTLDGSGSLDASGTLYFDANEVIIDGPDVTATDKWYGVYVYPWFADTATVTVESGSLTGIVSGAEFYPSEGTDYSEFVMSAGILVDEDSTLVVNGGTVSGVNENEGIPGMNPGIGFWDETSNLTLGEGVKVLDGDGNDITEDVATDPSVLNDYAEATITEEEEAPVIAIPTVASSLKQSIESEIKDAEGNVVDGSVRVDFYANHTFRVTVRRPGSFSVLVGKYEVKDGKLAFTLKDGTELSFDNNVLVLPLPNGGTVTAKLDKEVVDALLAS